MEQVAAACRMGKDTLYRRYPSKADLFTALMRGLQAALMPELDLILGMAYAAGLGLRSTKPTDGG